MSTPITNIMELSDPRRLNSGERSIVTAHLLRLSAEDRQLRFCRALGDDAISAYAQGIDFQHEVCLGTVDRQGALVAFAQGFQYKDRGERVMEAAFSTDAAWRRRGLGQLLFAEVTDYAATSGIVRVIAQCLAGNRPMRVLLRTVGTKFAEDERRGASGHGAARAGCP